MTRWLPAILAFALAACGPPPATGENIATARQPIVGGEPAPGYEAAVALIARRTGCVDPQPMLICSGALVAPDLVLTAAHCLDIFGEEGQYEIFFGERLLPGAQGRFALVAETKRHPAYDPETHAFDVALLRLAAPLAIEPFALPGPTDLPQAGAIARVIGFGATHDTERPAGMRLQGETEITEVGEAFFRARPAPAMSCIGDSGGPVLAHGPGGEILIGITASGDIACKREAVAVRVDALLDDFLRPEMVSKRGLPQGELSPASLCVAGCTSAADCPAGLACVPGEDGEGRCLLLSLREGNFGAICTDDAGCGVQGRCARLEPEGQEACRCFSPCAQVPAVDIRPEESGHGGGCATAGGGNISAVSLTALLAALAYRSKEQPGRSGRRPPLRPGFSRRGRHRRRR